MKLFIIRLNGWYPYAEKKECKWANLVRAENEEQARKIAANQVWDEGIDAWLNPSKSRCEELTVDGEPGDIMHDIGPRRRGQ